MIKTSIKPPKNMFLSGFEQFCKKVKKVNFGIMSDMQILICPILFERGGVYVPPSPVDSP